MKWLIENNEIMAEKEKETLWVNIHKNDNYNNVWSMTEDESVKNKILDEIKCINHKNILILGCGTRVELQHFLSEHLITIEEIVCTDHEEVIEIAKLKSNCKKINYVARNSRELLWEKEFDVVIVINSVLSDDDIENRKILRSCNQALKAEGILLGFFPTVFCGLEIAHLEKSYERLQTVDVESCLVFEKSHSMKQIFYTPLRLRYIFKEAFFKVEKMELFFCSSENFVKQARSLYGIHDEDIFVYELFVKSIK